MFSKKKKGQDEIPDILHTDEILPEDDFLDSDSVSPAKPAKKKLPGWFIIPIFADLFLAAFVISKLVGSVGGSSAGTSPQVPAVQRGHETAVYNSPGPTKRGTTIT